NSPCTLFTLGVVVPTPPPPTSREGRARGAVVLCPRVRPPAGPRGPLPTRPGTRELRALDFDARRNSLEDCAPTLRSRDCARSTWTLERSVTLCEGVGGDPLSLRRPGQIGRASCRERV